MAPYQHLPPSTRHRIVGFVRGLRYAKEHLGVRRNSVAVLTLAAETFGTNLSTVKRLLAKATLSDEEKLVMEARGRPVIFADLEPVRAAVRSLQARSVTVTLARVRKEMRAAGAVVPKSKKGLRSLLVRAGMRYGRPVMRNPGADGDGVVKHRRGFVRFMLELLAKRHGTTNVVVLDESYADACNVVRSQWYDPTAHVPPVNAAATTERWILLAAGHYVIKRGAVVRAQLVSDSVRIWQPSETGPNAPNPVVYPLGVPDDAIYQGNVTAALWEKWFSHLCKTLHTLGVRDALVIMDNAGIHGQLEERPPDETRKQAEIWSWVRQRHPDAAARLLAESKDQEKGPTKAQLHAFTRTIKFVSGAQRCAAAVGYKIVHTPPYTPELQPIGCIWAAVQNHLRRSQPGEAHQVREKLIEGFALLKFSSWAGAWRRSVEFLHHFKKYDGEGADAEDGGVRGDDE